MWNVSTAGRNLLFLLAGALAIAACDEARVGWPAEVGRFQFPVGLAVHPAGFAFVASANMDLAYSGGSLQVIDLNAVAAADLSTPDPDDPYGKRFLLDDQALGLDNFAATVELTADGSLLGVTVRETNRLVLVDVAVSQTGGSPSLELNCWPDGHRPSEDLPACDGARYLVNLQDNDPFDLLFIDGPEELGGRRRSATLTFLRSGMLEVLDIPGDSSQPVELLYTLDTGVYGNADLVRAPGTGLVFVSTRFADSQTNPISYFDPEVGDLERVGRFDLFGMLLGNETRGIDFAADGLTAGVLMRNPDMLVFLDTTPAAETGEPRHTFLGAVPMGNNPSRLRSRGDFMVASCAKDDTLYVVNSRSRRLVAVKEDVCRGPFEVAFWDTAERHWALVSCFEDDTVAILDFDPDSADFLRVLTRIGQPREEG